MLLAADQITVIQQIEEVYSNAVYQMYVTSDMYKRKVSMRKPKQRLLNRDVRRDPRVLQTISLCKRPRILSIWVVM